MKKSAILFFLLIAGFSYGQTERKPNSMDTLKRDLRTLGNVFKKAGAIEITINDIAYNNRHFTLFKQQVLKTPNVIKTETRQEQNNLLIVVTFKGKSPDLWEALPQNVKQPFVVTLQTDTTLLLNYRYAVAATRPVSRETSSPAPSTNKSENAGSKENVAVQLSPAAALLFKGVTTKLSDAEKNSFATGFRLSKDRKQFVSEADERGEFPYYVMLFPTDLNSDGKEEIFMVFGNTFTSGGTGSSVAAYIQDKAGKFQVNLGFPGVSPDVLTTRNLGYPDLLIGGMGFEFPVWRWNGKEYVYFKKVTDLEYAKLKKISIEDASKAYGKSLAN